MIALVALPAAAQDLVSVQDINAIPQANIDALKAAGADVTEEQVIANVTSSLAGQTVQIVAVVVTDPLKSGLSSPRDGGFPSRIHYFVRDTSFVSNPDGSGVQVVDGNYQTTGSQTLLVGDVVKMTVEVAYFGSGLQLSPSSIEVLGSVFDGFDGLPDTIVDPIVVTTSDIHVNAGEGQVRINWDNFEALNGQYVRLEDVSIFRSTGREESRPNWAVSSDGGSTIIQNDDISLRFRNDRAEYADIFDTRAAGDPFVGPAPGARANLQGIALLRSTFDPFAIGNPAVAMMKIVPFEDADLEITSSPTISLIEVGTPTGIVGNEAATIDINVVATSDDQIGSVDLVYFTSANPEEMTVEATTSGSGQYSATIPAQADGAFVTYRVQATDAGGAEFASEGSQTYRVLYDGINEISDIQMTADGGPGASPFAGQTVPMSITATVQSDGADSGFIVLQDDADLAPWSGIFVQTDEALTAALAPGDVITITIATIADASNSDGNFDVTQLRDITYSVESTGGATLGYKTVPTTALQNSGVAEAHEGMLLNFSNVTVVSNDAGFGEFTISSDGSADNAVRADDASDSIPSTYAVDNLTNGQTLDFIRGIWYFSFGDYKLLPETEADIMVGTDVDGEAVTALGFAAAYPNPFASSTTLSYTLSAPGAVRLAVYDVLGREIAVLADGVKGSGAQTATFDGSSLPSGLYFVRLAAEGRTITRTVTLQK